MAVSKPRQKLLKLALPIMGGMLSQSLLNLVDAALVGRLGTEVLAAVGLGGYVVFMLSALMAGLSSSVQTQVARRHGAQKFSIQALPLNNALVLACALGLVLTFIGWFNANWFLSFLTPDLQVQVIASEYMQVRALGFIPLALSLSFRGFWHGVQLTSLYLKVMLFTHLVNVILSYWLIYGGLGLAPLGAKGAALGTTLAITLSCCIWFFYTWQRGRTSGFLMKKPSLQQLNTSLKLALPNSVQQFLFAVNYAVLFWILGLINTASVAVGHLLVHLSLLLVLPSVGLGMAAMTLVSHSLGEHKSQQAYKWGWEAVRLASIILAILGLPMLLIPDTILGWFLHQENLIELGRLPLMLTGIMISLDAAGIVFNQALQGAGAQKMAMQLSLSLRWLVFLPLVALFGLYWGWGLLGVWVAQLLYRVINSSAFIYTWRQRTWAES